MPEPRRAASQAVAPDEAARALVVALRAELAAIDPVRPCDRAAERAGLGVAAHGAAPNPVVARLAVRLERGAGKDQPFDWESAAEHCRIAWLRGRFLARGSLSLAGGRTHLEFVVPAEEAPVLVARLGALGLPASRRIRRGVGVVTWKGAEPILRFFRLAGASAGLLELEARLVTRALQASLNRAVNAEGANLARAVRASSRQLGAIRTLEAAGLLAGERPPVRAVAQARLASPEASLSDLAAEIDLPRGVVQRSLERIERLAESRADHRSRGA